MHPRVVGQLRVERGEQVRPSRTSTGSPSSSASTSTPGPSSCTRGARMKTPCSGRSRRRARGRPRSWRPGDRTRCGRPRGRPRRGALRSSTIIPAQVPRTAPGNERIASSSPYSRASRMIVVDSPPGMTSPSRPSSCSGSRTSTTRPRGRAARRRAPETLPGARAHRSAEISPSPRKCRCALACTPPTPDPAPRWAHYQPRASSSCFGERRGRRCRPSARPAPRTRREDLGVGVVRRRLDDRLRAACTSSAQPSFVVLVAPRLEDAGADEDTVRAELHAQRRVGRRGDAARGEGDHRQAPVLRDPAHELDRRAELLRLGKELVLAQRAAGGSPPNTARMCVTALTMSPVPASPLVRIIAAPSAMRRSASPRFVQPQTNGTVNCALVDVVLESAGVSTSDSSM